MTGLFSKVAFLGQVTFLFSIFRQVTSYEGTPTELELSQGIVKGYIEPNLGIRVVQTFMPSVNSLAYHPVSNDFKSDNHDKELNGILVFLMLIHRPEIDDGKHRKL